MSDISRYTDPDYIYFYNPKKKKVTRIKDRFDETGASTILPKLEKHGITPGYWGVETSSGKRKFVTATPEAAAKAEKLGIVSMGEWDVRRKIKEKNQNAPHSAHNAFDWNLYNTMGMGLAPAVEATGKTIWDVATKDDVGIGDFGDQWSKNKYHTDQKYDAIEQRYEDQSPNASLAGTITGAMIPGIATGGGSMARQMAVSGGLAGLDTAINSDETGEAYTDDVIDSASIGAIAPPAFHAGGKALAATAKGIGKGIAALPDSVIKRFLKKTGMTIQEATEYLNSQVFRDSVDAKPTRRAAANEFKERARNLTDAQRSMSKQLGNEYADLQKQGFEESFDQLNFDSEPLAQLRKTFTKQQKKIADVGALSQKQANELQNAIDILDPKHLNTIDPEKTIQELIDLKRASGNTLRAAERAGNGRAYRAANKMKKSLDHFLKEGELKGASKFKEADELYSSGIDIPKFFTKGTTNKNISGRGDWVSPKKLYSKVASGSDTDMEEVVQQGMQKLKEFGEKYPHLPKTPQWQEYQGTFQELQDSLGKYARRLELEEGFKGNSPLPLIDSIAQIVNKEAVPSKAMMKALLQVRNTVQSGYKGATEIGAALDKMLSSTGRMLEEMRKEDIKNHLKHRSERFRRWRTNTVGGKGFQDLAESLPVTDEMMYHAQRMR